MQPARCVRARSPALACTVLRREFSSSSTTSHVEREHVLQSPFSDVRVPELNLAEFVWRKADRWKHWPALTCAVSGRSYTYGEARASAERLSLSLPDSAGLRPGDTLGLVMPNTPEFPLTLLGATAAGLVVSPANPVYTPEELARQFIDSGARAVVTVPALVDKVRKALELTPGGAQLVLATNAHEAARHDALSLDELLSREYTRRTPRAPRPDLDSTAILPYSSGTTGLPKGVRISHRNLVTNICQMEHPDVLPPPPEGFQDTTLAVLPFFHIYGLNGVMNLSLSKGRHTVTLPRFEPNLFAEALTRFKPTVLSVVPPLLLFLSATPLVEQSDLMRVRYITCGAAPATRALIEKFIKRANSRSLDFREGYGMTETSCLAMITPRWTGTDKAGSCGAPVPLTEVAVLDEAGCTLPPGRQGELVVRGPQVMQGYHNNAQASAEAFTQDGWLRTGDVAIVDDQGFVFLVDRMKELIKVKGLQVSPTELEGVLRTMAGVADVAVVGVPDERSGEVPRAFVVKNKDISEGDVATFLEERVAPFKRLKGGVKFVQEIPKNAAGKILRKALKGLDS